jgi:lipoprotein-anchoring transpeptidase ErfK/SrfK
VSNARSIAVGLLLACAVLGLSAAFAVTASGESETAAQTTTQPPTEPPPTAPPPTEPSPSPEPPRQLGIPSGVRVANVDVGGLMPYEASALLRERFARPLVVVGAGLRVSLAPEDVGAKAGVRKAVGRARFARPGTRVPLFVFVPRNRVRGFVESIAPSVDRPAVSAQIGLRGARIIAKPSKPGRRLDRVTASRAIRVAFKSHVRTPIALRFDAVKPKVDESRLGPAIVIMRSSNRLRLYENTRLVRTFGIATGERQYPTPLGAYEIVTMQRNPWWYPPPSDWAEDADPVPPGPGNPLGTRWMGISAPYVGIHGTPDAASIGYSASHGCVRMRISEAEWLFQRVDVGTPVFIVSR